MCLELRIRPLQTFDEWLVANFWWDIGVQVIGPAFKWNLVLPPTFDSNGVMCGTLSVQRKKPRFCGNFGTGPSP
jgi:hypothetical protein